MEEIKHPSGARMVLRTERIVDKVERILMERPTTRGNDMLLFYWFVKTWYPEVRITMAQFKDIMRIPSFESIRRRRQEIQNTKDEKGNYLRPELRPTERVKLKRERREEALKHHFGKGMTLEDYMNGE